MLQCCAAAFALKNSAVEHDSDQCSFSFCYCNLNFQMCKDNINDLTQKLVLTEDHGAELQKENIKLEEDLKKARYAPHLSYCLDQSSVVIFTLHKPRWTTLLTFIPLQLRLGNKGSGMWEPHRNNQAAESWHKETWKRSKYSVLSFLLASVCDWDHIVVFSEYHHSCL